LILAAPQHLLALRIGKTGDVFMSSAAANNGRRRVVVTPVRPNNAGVPWMKIIPVWIASAVINAAILVLAAVLFSFLGKAQAGAEDLDQSVQTTQVEEEQKEDADLTQTDIGMDSSVPYGLNVERTGEDVVVPGMVDVTQQPGVEGAPTDAPRNNVPLPPGTGDGLGGAPSNLENALAVGGPGASIGGMGGINLGQQFSGRSAATKKRMLNQYGGNGVSEAAVARGLLWLAKHQAQDGHWSLTDFPKSGRDQPRPAGKITGCNCQPGYSSDAYKVAATAMGLLPFLGAGITHDSKKTAVKDYTKVVEGAVHWLINQQSAKDGRFSSNMYEHGIATIAMCEAYGLTKDPRFKVSAQKALYFIVFAQDGAGGGWRYRPKEAGDTSVTGWQLMALKSGQMAGLSVPSAVLKKAERFLDSVESAPKGSSDKGGSYSYTSGQPPTPTMTSVGLLCRIYSGVGPKNPALRSGVKILKSNPPKVNPNIYYLYYATQVMHQIEGDSWKFWNEGVDEDGKKVHKGIRDHLISLQDKGTTPGHVHQAGSWAGSQGGRLMATSLSLLCLEVYYRHLPLYRRDITTTKEKN
jgi:hypothetical protein